MHSRIFLAIIFGLGSAAAADAAEVRVLTPRAITTVFDEVGPQFERSSGHRLTIVTDLAPTLAARINRGEGCDIFIGPPEQVDHLIEGGRIVGTTRMALARSGIGVEVRAGASKPDIGSVDDFKRALLAAKSIGYLKQGASGVYVGQLLDRLGVADAIRAKVIRPETDIVSELVARGDIELGMVVITQILTTPGVVLVGPLPRDLQFYVAWSGAVCTNAGAPDAAVDVLKFLTGPAATSVMKAQGMEPG